MSQWTGITESKVWYSNLNWEQRVRAGLRLPQVHNKAGEAVIRQMDVHQIYLADPEDTVILKEQPDEEFIDYVEGQLQSLPRLRIGLPGHFPEELANRLAVPYLVDREEADFLRNLNARWIGPDPDLAWRLNNKLETRLLCEQHHIDLSDGYICRNLKELNAAYKSLSKRYPNNRLVLKTEFGSSGKNMMHIYKPGDFEHIESLLAHRSGGRDFSISIERWHEAEKTMSAQLFIWSGHARLLAVTEQLTNEVGVYKGSILNPAWPDAVRERYEEQLNLIGSVLARMGYEGVIGVDSILDKQGRLLPAIEFNARLTLVTYLLKIINKLIEGGFPSIRNQYYDLKPGQFLSFSPFLAGARAAAATAKGERECFFVYGFHVSKEDESSRLCRIFILYWGIDPAHLQHTKQAVEQYISQTGRG
jgi:[BtrI acyl-carrier protein]--L-glutamate ligase